MFIKQFEVRWSDMDANRHLANSAYINFMSHTRMAFFLESGLSQKMMVENQLGPVVFYEHIYYYKEVLPGTPVMVSVEFKGMSVNGTLFEFHHNFYDLQGRNLAHSEMMGGWINSGTRRLTNLHEGPLEVFNRMEKAGDFRILTSADTRKFGKRPQDISPDVFRK